MRWKAHLYENSELNASCPLNYIFQSTKYPLQHKDLMQFENDLLELISVKFRKVNNRSLDQLQKDIWSIKKSKNVFIFADKTRNIYEADKNTCSKLLTDNISKTYRKAEHKIHNKVNIEAKIISNNYGVSERDQCLSKSNTFISLKDHESNFSSEPKNRLINPAKSEIGKISKYFLEQINIKVRD